MRAGIVALLFLASAPASAEWRVGRQTNAANGRVEIAAWLQSDGGNLVFFCRAGGHAEFSLRLADRRALQVFDGSPVYVQIRRDAERPRTDIWMISSGNFVTRTRGSFRRVLRDVRQGSRLSLQARPPSGHPRVGTPYVADFQLEGQASLTSLMRECDVPDPDNSARE